MKGLFAAFSLFILCFGLSLEAHESSSSSCSDECQACSALNEEECKLKTFCVTVPARQTSQGFIPSAEIYVRMQGKCKRETPVLLFVHGNALTEDLRPLLPLIDEAS